MIGLLVLVGAVCLLLGILIGLTAPHWLHGDPYDRLAASDRKRLA